MSRVERALAASGERVFDLVAIGASGFAALVIAGEAESSGRISGDATFVNLVLAALATLALWWRRSHPVAVAALFVPVLVVTDFVGLASLVALYTLIVRRRGRVIPVMLALHLLAAVAYSVIRPDPALAPPVEFLFTLAFLTATVAIAVAMRARRDLVEVLRERAARAEEETRIRAERLRALERERIAREMHDALAHRISMVSLHAGALVIRPDLTPEEVAKAATTIRDSAHQALEDLREILGVLRVGDSDGLRPQPGIERLDELVEDARAAGVPVEWANDLGDSVTGAGLGRTVYRLVQEGLTNAGKHACGTQVRLVLSRTRDDLLHVLVANPLSPANNGGVPVGSLPGAVPPGAGAGLVGLAERVELAGGRFEHGIRRDPDGVLTFRLEAWLPWPEC
ncbi:two-component sensor histidine kinase [Actinoplanes cyaneus]|uniref:histidine kinase n=1 Tax=Actinoplanes cyaneus TaxID=52696 RepID=A0A919ICT2_9ACTN|nr:histidine kinase [Actinoplanes cyaneus]MCW2135740.1 Signal transduction histidine kinase [Actinoplanes cyaneus]GID62896.1 two-component sensor histidine kinase [Actinoplanes cyaneus]